MNFAEALRYLLSLGHETLAIKLGLTNTERLLDALGNPQESLPKVQIAGTNGKGSTAQMLEAICRAAGLRTGLYTSPHLVNITERVRVCGQEITTEEFARLTSEVRAASESLVETGVAPTPPTFFEQVTAIALCAFRAARVEVAILETGLGGRLDATTAACAKTVALTPIALDHQEYLGDTLAEVAAEKAAIIQPGVVAVVAPQPPVAQAVIQKRCAAVGVVPRMVRPGEITGVASSGHLRATFETEQNVYASVLLGLRGRHQTINAAVAVELAEVLRERGFHISREAIICGLETAWHAGRLEMSETRPAILFDGAHNAAGARALRAYLDEFVKVPVTLLFGAMRDKDLEEMAAALFPRAQQLILSPIDNPRTASVESLSEIAARYLNTAPPLHAADAGEALRLAQQKTARDALVCCTGSLYLVGEVQTALAQQRA